MPIAMNNSLSQEPGSLEQGGSSNIAVLVQAIVAQRDSISGHSVDDMIWEAQFNGIGGLLQQDERKGILQGGGPVTINYTVCRPYNISLQQEFNAYYTIFHTRFQVWASSKGLSYSQKVIENGVIEMTFLQMNV